MKKTLVFGLIVAALGFTACNKENPTQGENTKGMVLKATVEQPAETRATINNETAEWKFAFAQNDKIEVTNSSLASGTYYTFTNDGTDFKSEDAKITSSAVDWYAYFPSATIELKNQPGTLEGVANLYALAGKTNAKTTGEGGLSIAMSAKVAILKIIYDWDWEFVINVKSGPSAWVVGMKAKDGEADFDLITTTEKNSLFRLTRAGTYYVAVPAGVKLQILVEDETLKFTQEAGLSAGKYYELTVGLPPITGTAKRIGNIDVPWVQLWENGPKFAVYNVGATNSAEELGGHYCWGGSKDNGVDDYYIGDLTGGDITLKGDYDTATKLWGSNWRMPSPEELVDLWAYDNTSYQYIENYQGTGINGYLFTGKGYYKDNSLFLPFAGFVRYDDGKLITEGENEYAYYWTNRRHQRQNDIEAWNLMINKTRHEVGGLGEKRSKCVSVRAVLK